MTQIPNPFWTNTKVNLTKPELSVTFNSYNLHYDVYFMNAENKPQTIPQGNQKNMVHNYPKIPSAVKINKKACGSMWTDALGNTYCDNCDTSGSDGACPYDNLSCPSDKVFLGKTLSGNERGDCPADRWDKTKCCGGSCQSAQLVFCGTPNLECSITVGSGNCISNSN